MSTILQLNFHFDTTAADYEETVSALAEDFAAVPGLRWKIWLLNESEGEAGGIYLFEDESSREAYLESQLAASVMAHPALHDFSAKLFDVMEEITAITRGPVGQAVEI